MDNNILGLGIALGYPEQAFGDVPLTVLDQAEELVRRAGCGEPVAAEVAEFLRSQVEVGGWVVQLLEDEDLRPPHLRSSSHRSYSRLAARDHGPVSAPRYTCVNCGYPWYRGFAGDPVPNCPFCREELVRA